jgi:hypothetical protein
MGNGTGKKKKLEIRGLQLPRGRPGGVAAPAAAAPLEGMARLLAATVSLALVCHGTAFSFSVTGYMLPCPCSSGGAQLPARPPGAGGGLTRRAFAAGGQHATGSCRSHRFLVPSANGLDRPTLLRANSDGVTGGGERPDNQSYPQLMDRMAKVPILGIFVRFARWVASVFRSILLVRMAVLLQAVAQAKTALLDPQRRLVSFIPIFAQQPQTIPPLAPARMLPCILCSVIPPSSTYYFLRKVGSCHASSSCYAARAHSLPPPTPAPPCPFLRTLAPTLPAPTCARVLTRVYARFAVGSWESGWGQTDSIVAVKLLLGCELRAYRRHGRR